MLHGRFIWSYGHYTTPNCLYGRLLAYLISRVIGWLVGTKLLLQNFYASHGHFEDTTKMAPSCRGTFLPGLVGDHRPEVAHTYSPPPSRIPGSLLPIQPTENLMMLQHLCTRPSLPNQLSSKAKAANFLEPFSGVHPISVFKNSTTICLAAPTPTTNNPRCY
jgi:hypothetical protein